MSSQAVAPTLYLVVYLSLVALTLSTVGLALIDLGATWHVVLGLSIAAAKATLIGWFFMHLRESRPGIWAVVLVALFWLFVVLMALTFSDYLTRPLTP